MAQPGNRSDSPISRPVTVSVLPAAGFSVVIEPNERERMALARTHDLDAVESFTANLVLKRWRKDGVRVVGDVSASVRQACVVTLQPVVSDIGVPIDAVFLPEGSRLSRPFDEDGAMIVDPNGPDLPETFSGGVLDAGAVAEEFFELAIDHYPRADDAEMPEENPGDDANDAQNKGQNPFAGLSALRDKL